MQALGFEGLMFRYLVAVDVEDYSQRDTAHQAMAQNALERVLSRAEGSAGLGCEHWTRMPGGDGELAILPECADGLSLVATYPSELASSLADVNRESREPRLRLRLAIHHGAVARVSGRFGPVGKAVIAISRLVDSEAVRHQLRQRNDLDVAMIVSSVIYGEVIQSGLRDDLCPGDFRRACVRAKGISYVGYLRENNPGISGTGDRRGTRLAAVSAS